MSGAAASSALLIASATTEGAEAASGVTPPESPESPESPPGPVVETDSAEEPDVAAPLLPPVEVFSVSESPEPPDVALPVVDESALPEVPPVAVEVSLPVLPDVSMIPIPPLAPSIVLPVLPESAWTSPESPDEPSTEPPQASPLFADEVGVLVASPLVPEEESPSVLVIDPPLLA